MAYTKYSLTPANNNATPPDGAPEGMLPSAVNDTMRDMMAQIRDVGDGIRGGTYTMTAPVITGGSITGVALSGNTFTNPVITGGSINNTPIGASTANTGAFTTLSATGATTLSGTTVVSGSLTANTFSSSGATITGGSINSTAIGGSTAAAGKFTTLEATGVTTVQAGTVSAPAITTTGDTNTGIFFPAADTIAFTEGGAEGMRIDSSGRVGIGTNSPAAKLDVSNSSGRNARIGGLQIGGTSTSADAGNNLISSGAFWNGTNWTATATTAVTYQLGNGVSVFYTDSGLTAGNTFTATERMRIDSAGNVGIGTSSPVALGGFVSVTANGSTGSFFDVQANATSIGRIVGTTSAFNIAALGASIPLTFQVNGSERMRITSTGNVGIGTSSPASILNVSAASPTITLTATTTTGTTIGNKNNRLLLLANSSTVNNGGEIVFAAQDTDIHRWAAISGAIEANSVSGAAGSMVFATKTNSADTSLSERMRITSSGNVGIGLTPTASVGALQVSGGAFASSTLYVGQAGSTAFSGGIQNLSNTSRSISIEADPTNAGANSLMYFNVDGSTRMAIDSSGNVLVGITSARANAGDVQVSKGISFPATQSAQSDANTLDDYEEGTWTPVISCDTVGNLSVTYSTQAGFYTKVGRQVTVSFSMTTSTFTHTTASGLIRLTGLPFTVLSTTGNAEFGAVAMQGYTKAGYTQVVCGAYNNTTSLLLPTQGTGQNLDNLAITDLPTGNIVIIRGTVTYFV